jgi:hypothetical protein
MPHFLDVRHMRPDRAEKFAKARALAETVHVPGRRIPFDAQHEHLGLVHAAAELIGLAMHGRVQHAGGPAVIGDELFGGGRRQAIADVFDDHGKSLFSNGQEMTA